MIRSILAALWILLPAAANADAQPKPDASPHKVQTVTVDKNVRLEVLDWGGTGQPLVFLAGLGNTAHVFDTFAVKFTAHHHVYAITRRGIGVSSAPPPVPGAYAADRLGKDVLAVIDFLRLDRPILAGWSIAGGELSVLGSEHPQKIAGLIYLDAGYSYGYYDSEKGNLLIDANELRNKLDRLFALNGPELIGPTDDNVKASIQELLQTNLPQVEKDLRYWQKMAQTLPHVPAQADGPDNPHQAIADAVLRGAQRSGKITIPVLAIFAVPHLWPTLGDTAAHAAVVAEDTVWDTAIADAFQAGIPSARVVRLGNADHEIWKTHEADVEREMNAFMDGLPKAH